MISLTQLKCYMTDSETILDINDFAFTNKIITKKDKKWMDILITKKGNYKNLFLKVMNDAQNHIKDIKIKGGSYYSCARFINKYHKTYKYKKRTFYIVTCCNSYPNECGGMCCRMKNLDDECGCWKLPPSSKHIKNCYDDCCNVVKYTSKRFFYLSWC